MSVAFWAAVVGVFVCGALVGRQRSGRLAVVWSVLALCAGTTLGVVAELSGWISPLVPFGCVMVGGLAVVTVLSRPITWREPAELARLVETALLVGGVFAATELKMAAVLWLVSFLPGVLGREQAHVSRRPVVLLAALSGAPVAVALLLDGQPGLEAVVYGGLVLGGALRMGVLPASPLLMASYDRLPMGRAVFTAAIRPSVALILVAHAAMPSQVASMAGPLQIWAVASAVCAALQGLVQDAPRRGVGAMATTQGSIVLFGLVSPGHLGVLGALMQWVGLGISLVGLGLVLEAMESRLGPRRASRVQGLLGPAPGIALFFLFFAATMSGFPGTSGFAGEDMIMQSPMDHGLALRLLLLAATALNGATMLRMFARTFMGPLTPEAEGFPPMSIRELVALGALAAALGLLVLWPGLVVYAG